MARYIDADALISTHIEAEKSRYGNRLVVGDNRFLQRFMDAPAADVQEVKHGKWVEDSDPGEPIGLYWACSNCHLCIGRNTEDEMRQLYHYCPNCGARMDGE